MKKFTIFLWGCGFFWAPGYPSVLSDAAASLNAGEVAVLKTNGFYGNVNGWGNDLLMSGPANRITEYGESGHWDPVSRQAMFEGSAHTNNDWRFILYNESHNTWRSVKSHPSLENQGVTHAWDHNALDPVNGVHYMQKQYGGQIYAFHIQSETWSHLPNTPAPAAVYRWQDTQYGGLEFFPEMGGLVAAAKGWAAFYNTTTQQWISIGQGLAMGNTNEFVEYSPMHKVMIFGGGNGSNALYRFSSSGVLKKQKNSPVSLSIQNVSTTADPVSGKFLVHSGNTLFEYNALADTWTNGTNPFPFTNADDNIFIPISTYGVIMVIHFDYNRSEVYLYKHTECPSCPLNTGVREKKAPGPFANFRAFPNPFKSTISIQRSPLGHNNGVVRVFNAEGQLVQELKTGKNKTTTLWTPGDIQAGVYFIRAKIGNKTLTQKVIRL